MANSILRTTKLSRHRRWTAHFKNLGKVTNADIEVAPLLLLVGRNNTGKSYVASTIWGLTSLWEVLSLSNAPLPKWWSDFCKGSWSSGGLLTITPAQAVSAASFVNRALKKATPAFCEQLFSFPGFSDTELSITPEAVSVGLNVSFSTVRVPGNAQSGVRRFVMTAADGKLLFELDMSGDADEKFWHRYAFTAIVEFILFGGEFPLFDGIYLPAARTGLVLAHRALTSRGVSGLLPQENAPTLSRPLRSFVNRFARAYAKPQRHDVADWMQKQTMDGIVATGPDGKELVYEIAGGKVIPLHATSSMITELTPFIMILKADRFFDRLVFEEPEAHLHLAAQRTMARAIARLVNSGIQVTVTTHSDTFLQQLNNLMHLYGHRDRTKIMADLGYSEEDLIDPKSARAYEFIATKDGTTSVVEAPATAEGFGADSLNSVLVELSRETLRLQD